MYIPSSRVPGYNALISSYNTRAKYEGSMTSITNRTDTLSSISTTPGLADSLSISSGIGKNIDIRI